MMAAVRLDCELKNPIICHCVCLPNRVFVKTVTLEKRAVECTAGLSLLLESSTKVQNFLLLVGPMIPDRKGKKLGRENTLIRKKAASKQSFGFVSGRELGDFRLTMKENPGQGTG